MSLLEGYASTDRSAADLLRAMGASKWQIFYHLEFPAALSYFFFPDSRCLYPMPWWERSFPNGWVV